VRYVRMLRRCMIAVCTLSVVTLGAASPAIAKKSAWTKFEQCPFGSKVVTPEGAEIGPDYCFFGEAGPESFFQAGKVTIHFVKPIDLRGALADYTNENGERINPFIGPRNNELITKEAEPSASLTEGVDAEKLEEPEKKRYEEYIAAGKSTKTTETIELSKPSVFVSLHTFFAEVGPSFGFSVFIHIKNPFLGKTCQVGSTVTPIEVPFTTGETAPPPPNEPIRGGIGDEFEEESSILSAEATLVDNEYASPGVTGCGINGGADAALDAGLGLPSPAGSNTTELIGKLYLSSAGETEKHIHL
jgi:hypothetical protein